LPVAAPDVQVAPAFCWVPPHETSAGSEVADFAETAGMPIDGEQRLALNAMFAEHEDGANVAFEYALIAARQNIETHTLRAATIADLFLFRQPLSIWTAHRMTATLEAFTALKATIDDHDHLRRRVKRISDTNGEEEIELLGGPRLKFMARSKGAGRSLTANRLTLDEAYDLDPSDMGSLMPTMAAVVDAQLRYGSSAGHTSSAVLRAVRDRGRRGADPSLTYLEWGDSQPPSCVEPDCDHTYGTEGCCLDDKRRWQRANPAAGRRISWERLEAMRRGMPPDEFAREVCGWWDDPIDALEVVFDMDLWSTLFDREYVERDLVMALD
jgi:hypothetical protein